MSEVCIGMVAGEASGDLLGAHLVGALAERRAGLSFHGIGGPRMMGHGFDSVFPMEKLSVRGYVEVLRHYREIMGIRRNLLSRLLDERPTVFIGIDAPDFNLDLEYRLKAAGIPTIHYVSPSIWAWRRSRLRRIARSVSHMLVLFPFETDIYRQAGVPVRIYTVHGWAFKVPGERGSSFYRFAERILRPFATLVICVSQTELAAGLIARACTRSRSLVIPNAVSVAGFETREHRRCSPVRVTSVGRLAAPKDFETLLAAVGQLDQARVHLSIVGEGPARGELETLVDRLGIRPIVEFAGEVADVPTRLSRSDVFVLSSRSEGLPISVLEAMAAGLPVVATAVGGLAELVDHGTTGFLVPPGDIDSLARRVEELVDDPALRARMGSAARQRAHEVFDLGMWEAAHRRVYRDLLERTQKA